MRFRARAGDWRVCVLRDSDRILAQWRHRERTVSQSVYAGE